MAGVLGARVLLLSWFTALCVLCWLLVGLPSRFRHINPQNNLFINDPFEGYHSKPINKSVAMINKSLGLGRPWEIGVDSMHHQITPMVHFPPYFPSDLLDVMGASCVSVLCIGVYREHNQPDFVQRLERMAESESTSSVLNHQMAEPAVGWDNALDVIDVLHASVDNNGHVAVCTEDNQVGAVFEGYGCTGDVHSGKCDAKVQAVDKVIVISQIWGECYFHYIVEDLPRIVSAVDYLNRCNESVSEWHVHHKVSPTILEQSLELLGVKGMVNGYVLANRVLLPKPSSCGGRLGDVRIPRFRLFVHLSYGINVDPSSPRSTLVVFKRNGVRAISNHAAMFAEIKRLWKTGGVVEHSGTGTLREQMGLYASAAGVIGPHGSGLSNSISMLYGSILVEILPELGGNRLNMCYMLLAFNLGLRYYALRAPGFNVDGVGTLPVESLALLPIWDDGTLTAVDM